MCRGGTLQSAECHPCTSVAECHPALRIRFGTLRQWCVNFLPRIFYPFWSPHGQKLRIGLFDHCATKWCFWLACDQNLNSVLLWCDYMSNFSKFRPVETSDLHASGPESFTPGFLTYFGRPTAKNYELVFLTVVRPNGVFDQRATKTRVRSFCPSCDYFPISVLWTNGATNGG